MVLKVLYYYDIVFLLLLHFCCYWNFHGATNPLDIWSKMDLQKPFIWTSFGSLMYVQYRSCVYWIFDPPWTQNVNYT